MTARETRDVAASIRGRLEQLSRERGEDFQITLIRWVVERFLRRLSRSVHRDRFLLKGAMLFTVWGHGGHRPTRDLDLLGRGDRDHTALRQVFVEILETPAEPDGVEFAADTVRLDALHEEQDYPGIRLSIEARVARARVPLRVDVAFGQAVSPPAELADYPSMLGMDRPRLRVYPREVVVAEKFQALVALGVVNSRLKDFYDLDFLASTFEFDAALLGESLAATFERRRTPLPESTPLALTAEFHGDPDRLRDWTAFLRRIGLQQSTQRLNETCVRIERFVMPVVGGIREGAHGSETWSPSRGWARR